MDIITIIIGVVLFFSKEIHLTKSRIIASPKLQYAGATLITLTLIDIYISRFIPDESLWISTVVLFVIMFVAIFALSSPLSEKTGINSGENIGNKSITIITWTVLVAVLLALLYFASSFFVSKDQHELESQLRQDFPTMQNPSNGENRF